MLWISRNGTFEFSVDLSQWIVGANFYDDTLNVFLLCFRVGYHRPRSSFLRMRAQVQGKSNDV